MRENGSNCGNWSHLVLQQVFGAAANDGMEVRVEDARQGLVKEVMLVLRGQARVAGLRFTLRLAISNDRSPRAFPERPPRAKT